VKYYLIEHDDVMVRVFMQTLIGLSYEWYMSLPTRSISSFDDFDTMFMTMYSPSMAYHTLLTYFTQIHLKKGEKIRYFNLRFFKMLNQIPEEKRPNNPVMLGCHKNYMPAYVKYVIRVAQIEYLGGAMRKETKMEVIMIETNVDPDIILGKVQRKMDNLVI
jgi:hypothetical protein